MPKFISILLLIFFTSCQTQDKKYYNFHKLDTNSFEKDTSNKYQNVIYIRSFYNNVVDKKVNGFKSLTYNYSTKEKIYIQTEKNNRRKFKTSNTELPNFKEFDFILENYLNGNIDYLQSLQDSFTSAEIGSYFYIFDFRNKKIFKVNAIIFDSNNNLVQ
mgnify:CR=1 FL=1